MSLFLVTETSSRNKPYYQKYYRLELPNSSREIRSFNAFFSSSRKDLLRPNVTEKRLYSDDIWELSYRDIKLMEEAYCIFGIYNFFDVIGYDHRKGKYLNGERILRWNSKKGNFI